MKAYLLGGAMALAAMVASAPAFGSAVVYMGPGDPGQPGHLNSTNNQVTIGNNPTVMNDTNPNDADSHNANLFAGSTFTIYGLFDVDNALTAQSVTSLIEGAGGLSNVNAGVYAWNPATNSVASTTPIASLTAELGQDTAWVLDSPVAFSMAPGTYALMVRGNKGAGAVLQYQLSVTSVPLPGAAMMFGAGLLVIGGLATRRKQMAAQAI